MGTRRTNDALSHAARHTITVTRLVLNIQDARAAALSDDDGEADAVSDALRKEMRAAIDSLEAALPGSAPTPAAEPDKPRRGRPPGARARAESGGGSAGNGAAESVEQKVEA